jgi:hypothetical protein
MNHMNNLSRGTWLAIAAVAAIPATVAIAKTVDRGGWHNMTPETRSRIEEGRIAMVKAALQLSADQEKLWAPVESTVRDSFKAREEKRAEWAKKREERRAEKDAAEPKRRDLSERYERMSQHLAERADRMKAFSTAFKPFYASLSDEQKDVLRPLMRQLTPGFGHGDHGPRWAFGGGWGPGGGPGHHGHHGHHGWRGGPDGPGAPGMQNEAPDDDTGPGAPAEPDKKG